MTQRCRVWTVCILLLSWAGPLHAQESSDAQGATSALYDRDEMIRALIGLVGAGIAGLVGGGVGVYFHMRRRRHETAFDRQLVWCEGALAAFHETGAAVAAAEHARVAESPLAAECWAIVADCYEKLIPISGQRVLYATPEGAEAISEFMSSLEQLIATSIDSAVADTSQQSDVCLGRLQNAWLALSIEARKHLALAPLNTGGSPQFTRSFRGIRTDHRS